MSENTTGPETPFVLEGDAEGAPLHGILQTPGDGHWPTVIVCHGFKGFMEWGFFPPLAELLVDRGYAVVRFNFSGTGMAPGDELVTSPEAFRANTISQEHSELRRILAVVGREIGESQIDRGRLALIGHSRGGAGVILAAGSEEWRGQLRAIVSWAAVSDFDYYDDAAKALWRRQGELPVANARTGQQLALGIGLLQDLEENRVSLDLLAAASRIEAPWLIVHGDADEAVPVASAHALASRARSTHELLVVPGSSHTFGARHPFAGPTPDLIQVLNATQTWLRRHL